MKDPEPFGSSRGLDDPAHQAARCAGLRYVNDAMPGIRRIRKGAGFIYLNGSKHPIRDPETLARIRALAIPPAWSGVWICPDRNGHLQAVGRDARGRKQYRYHRRWRETRDETKYHRLLAFARALPGIRRRISSCLARPGLSREKVLAAVIRLLEVSCIRVGNEAYARSNRSFGLTTLQDRHVRVSGEEIRFDFRGKSGKRHHLSLEDPRLARIVKQCQDIPGQDLFQYLDEEGHRRDVTSDDVNEFIREISKGDFSAKDFRTWAGTLLMLDSLLSLPRPTTRKQARQHIVDSIRQVAVQLGNTPAVCRKCYIHPAVLEGYDSDPFWKHFGGGTRRSREGQMVQFLKLRRDQEQDPRRLEKELSHSIRQARRARQRSSKR